MRNHVIFPAAYAVHLITGSQTYSRTPSDVSNRRNFQLQHHIRLAISVRKARGFSSSQWGSLLCRLNNGCTRTLHRSMTWSCEWFVQQPKPPKSDEDYSRVRKPCVNPADFAMPSVGVRECVSRVLLGFTSSRQDLVNPVTSGSPMEALGTLEKEHSMRRNIFHALLFAAFVDSTPLPLSTFRPTTSPTAAATAYPTHIRLPSIPFIVTDQALGCVDMTRPRKKKSIA